MNAPLTKENRALEIVRTAKVDPARAERLILALASEIAPGLGVRTAQIRESKLSLNSVNGVLDGGTKKYFFKFHAEEGENYSLKSEYYNARILREQGWPMVEPIFASTTPGLQFVVYDYVEAPVAYDLYGAQDERYLESQSYDEQRVSELLAAERVLAQKISKAHLASLQISDAAEIEKTSLNQLFYNRLALGTPAEPSRLEQYYLGKDVALLGGGSLPFDSLAKRKWVINGVLYTDSLEKIIEIAKDLLNPAKERHLASVVGHGDDHNGNKFFIDGVFRFFDPAFAGRQPALLSSIKATAHNCFLHPFWLYEPEKLEEKLKIEISINDNSITVYHNWKVEELSPLRMKILDIYAKECWQPLIAEIAKRGWLPSYWKEYIRSALFCSPFMVLNLIDAMKFSPEESLLALSKCVELGSKGDSVSAVEDFLESISPRI